jgi:hypothetical protein
MALTELPDLLMSIQGLRLLRGCSHMWLYSCTAAKLHIAFT